MHQQHSEMSVPHRKSYSEGSLGYRPVSSREKEPGNVSGETYWMLMKGNIPLKSLAAAKDGQGLFTRPGANIRALVDDNYDMINAFADVTWFPKKTTIQDALELCNKDLEGKLLQGKEADRITKVRAEAYAVKSMFLEVINAEKSTSTGEKLSSKMAALVKKFKSIRKVKEVLAVSPFLGRVKANIAAARQTAATMLPTEDVSPVRSKDMKTPSPVRQPIWEESDVSVLAEAMTVSKPTTSLADRLFPLEFDVMDSQGSNCSGPDVAELVKKSADLTCSSGSIDMPAVKNVDFYKLLGLEPPSKRQKVLKPGPNGFVVELTPDGEIETDEPNLLFVNRDMLVEFEKKTVAALAEAKQKANEKKKLKAKEKADQKKNEKLQEKSENQKKKQPQKVENNANEKVENIAKKRPEVLQPQEEHADGRHYRNINLTSAFKGVVRSYLTGIDKSGKRSLITELTAKNNPQHKELMTRLKSLLEEGNWTKAQAVIWRDSQKVNSI